MVVAVEELGSRNSVLDLDNLYTAAGAEVEVHYNQWVAAQKLTAVAAAAGNC